MRELICEILRAQDFSVDGVADTSTLSVAEKTAGYAVAVADIPMGERADVFADRLTTSMPLLRTHLVLISASPEDCENCDSEAPTLMKPFDRQSLVDTVARISGH